MAEEQHHLLQESNRDLLLYKDEEGEPLPEDLGQMVLATLLLKGARTHSRSKD